MSEWVAAEWWLVDDSGPVREIKAFIEAPGDPDGLFHLMEMYEDHYFKTLEEAQAWGGRDFCTKADESKED